MEGGMIAAIVIWTITALFMLPIILYGICGFAIPLLISIVDWILYKTRTYHCIYYILPDEFKEDPEKAFHEYQTPWYRRLGFGNAVVCNICNGYVFLYQIRHAYKRLIVDRLQRILFSVGCSCGILKQKQGDADICLPEYHQSSSSTIEANNHLKNEKNISPPPPILKVPPHTSPMSITIDIVPSVCSSIHIDDYWDDNLTSTSVIPKNSTTTTTVLP